MRPNLETEGVILSVDEVEFVNLAQQLVCAEVSDQLPDQFKGKELRLPENSGEINLNRDMSHRVCAVATLALKKTTERGIESRRQYNRAKVKHADDFTLMAYRMEMTLHEESRSIFGRLIQDINQNLDESEAQIIDMGLSAKSADA